MLHKLRELGLRLKRELAVLRLVLKHPRTPRRAKVLLGLALGYLLLPFDIIPDWIPVLGHLDDVVIVPGLVYLALKMVPKEVIEECRARVNPSSGQAPQLSGPSKAATEPPSKSAPSP